MFLSVPGFNVEDILSLLKPGGMLAERLDGYEQRDGQLKMLRAVAIALEQGQHVMVEAGTGTGKSIAYLLPAIIFSRLNKTPVVISTNTRNLQEQLINKDIPGLLKALGRSGEIKASVLKGKSNYICLRRYENARPGMLGNDSGIRLVPRITAWLARTSTGDRAELTLNRHETTYWSQVCAREGECLTEHCRFLGEGRCFLHNARQEARSAQLLVVNHALLLADAASENKLLPPYRHLVLDEAHHLEEVATHQFGFAFSKQSVDEDNQETSRWLRDLDMHLRLSRISPSLKGDIANQISSVRAEYAGAGQALAPVWSSLEGMFSSHEVRGGGLDADRLLDSSIRHDASWETIQDLWENAAKRLDDSMASLGRLHAGLRNLDWADASQGEAFMAGLTESMESVRLLRELGTQALVCPDERTVYWVSIKRTAGNAAAGESERPRRGKNTATRLIMETVNVSVCAAPLEVATPLAEALFSDKESVILTSATLSGGGDFGYLKRQLGFEPVEELTVGSPFDYFSSTLLCLPEDVPEPRAPEYHDAVATAIEQVAAAAGGRTLALFTSHEALRKAHSRLSEALARNDISVLGQVIDGPAEQVLQAFKDGQRMVLLGTSSLWEGIDVVGDALSVLIIARLPFAVPTDPLQEARSQLFEDPFREYSLPQAVMRLKQGFGRLIRSEGDRGAVLILDRRIHSKAYGKVFIDSLPECRQARGTVMELSEQIGEWLNQPGGFPASA
jgi:DNA polymerase-3 subunit epsilon/ATP-dependent DNA helicase DinG